MSIVIYHNPECGTSRNVLTMLEAGGESPVVIEYLKEGWTRPQLLGLFAASGLTPRQALRVKKSPAEALGLLDENVSDETLIEAMITHPILVNRPFVVSSKGTKLCRPSEEVLDLLSKPLPESFVKEDGQKPEAVVPSFKEGALDDLPHIKCEALHPIKHRLLSDNSNGGSEPVKILLLYGSLRKVSYSKLTALEAERLLKTYGVETRLYNPEGLPLPDGADVSHPKVQELRDLASWCDGMVWVSPERHGAMTGILKAQIDWIPLSLGAVRPTQGKTLALMQVCGGSQSFNAVNQMRILGRWMRMVTIPNQSSIAKAFLEFDNDGRMKPSSYYNRVVDVVEELVKFTLMVRGRSSYLTDRYSERVESAEALSKRVNKRTS